MFAGTCLGGGELNIWFRGRNARQETNGGWCRENQNSRNDEIGDVGEGF